MFTPDAAKMLAQRLVEFLNMKITSAQQVEDHFTVDRSRP
jgi:hypothetical protein